MKVRFIPAARQDAADAAAALDSFRSGWGHAIEAEVRRSVAAIGANPRMHARTEDGPDEPENREYFIARFEYRVIYSIWREETIIAAVIHARDRPVRGKADSPNSIDPH